MNKSQVVICLAGGVIHDIYASDRETGIVLVDWDTEEAAPDDPAMIRVQVGCWYRQVRVVDFPPLPLAELAGTDAEMAVEAAFQEGVLHEPSC